VEPGFEADAQPGPFTVQDGEPGGVPVSATDDSCLPKCALIGEAEPLGGRSGRRIESVTLPLVAPVAKVVENMPHQQILRLGGRGPALQRRGEVQVTDLDRAGIRLHPQEARHSDGPARPQRRVDDRQEHRVGLRTHLLQPHAIRGQVGERAVGQVSPAGTSDVEGVGGEQLLGVRCGIKRLQPTEASP